MDDTQGVVRMNISVPREIKARMAGVGESVNWSAVAVLAFLDKLPELEGERRVKDMDDVVARLRALEALEAKEGYQAGFAAGEGWAMGAARPSELRGVSGHVNRLWKGQGGPHGWWSVADASDRLAFSARPGVEGDQDGAREFWEEALGGEAHEVKDSNFLRGFGCGAEAVWKMVRDKL